MDTFVVRLVLAVTVLAWGSVLLHDLVTPDSPAESTFTPAAAVDRPADEGNVPLAPSEVPPTANATSVPPR